MFEKVFFPHITVEWEEIHPPPVVWGFGWAGLVAGGFV